MPLISVDMIEGRTPEQIENLIKGIAEAVMEAIDAPEDSIRVRINEYKKTHWGMGTLPAHKAGR